MYNDDTMVQDRLFALSDAEYADFQHKIIPNVSKEHIVGVRVPALRRLAKLMMEQNIAENFIHLLPHVYFDENMLHGILVSELDDYEQCLAAVGAFLPYIDNWAVCDVLVPKIFKKHREELISNIKDWIKSSEPYTCRFGLKMLMTHFLDENFNDTYLKLAASVHSNHYYVNMMQAWFFATALAKQWGSTMVYIQNRSLDTWVHNKTILKACESHVITVSQKDHLRRLKTASKTS